MCLIKVNSYGICHVNLCYLVCCALNTQGKQHFLYMLNYTTFLNWPSIFDEIDVSNL